MFVIKMWKKSIFMWLFLRKNLKRSFCQLTVTLLNLESYLMKKIVKISII